MVNKDSHIKMTIGRFRKTENSSGPLTERARVRFPGRASSTQAIILPG